MEESNPELESFRQQWRDEVSAKQQGATRKAPAATNAPSSSQFREEHSSSSAGTANGHTVEGISKQDGKTGSREPRSALEHYELAVEVENQGNLNESLNLYRKAFRMDDQVDKLYKNKHFPPSSFAKKPPTASLSTSKPNSSAAASSAAVLATNDLILSFSQLPILPAAPEVEGMQPPPSPLSKLPAELLTSVLMQVALLDLPSFVRLSLVCKKMAYLIATEETVWKRLSLGKEVGFGGMFYKWQCDITGETLSTDTLGLESLQIQDDVDLPVSTGTNESKNTTGKVRAEAPEALTQRMITDQLLTHTYFTYHNMFRLRPRLRFNGIYISTITYHRPGQASVDQITWSAPVHTVTYYRYLRFFRDGTCISLSTTAEPIDVVSMITRESLEKYAGKGENERRDRRYLVGGDGDASAVKNVMKNALKGRWHLSSLISPDTGVPNPEISAASGEATLAQAMESAEGDCFVETEGVFPKHTYRMDLSLKNEKLRGRARRNQRLFWKGYYLYNKITGDWGEFGLRNDKSFVFSRVRSYED